MNVRAISIFLSDFNILYFSNCSNFWGCRSYLSTQTSFPAFLLFQGSGSDIPEETEPKRVRVVLVNTGTLLQGPKTGVLLVFVESEAETFFTLRVQTYFNVIGMLKTCENIME